MHVSRPDLIKNELLHTFGLYNAIVVAKDGTRIHWNNALEFAREVEPLDWPVVDISEYPDIQKAVEDFLQKPRRMFTPPQSCPDRPDGWVPLAELPAN